MCPNFFALLRGVDGALFPALPCWSSAAPFFTYLLAMRAMRAIRRDQVVGPKGGQPRWPRVRWTLVCDRRDRRPVIGVTICFGALRWFENVYQSHAIEVGAEAMAGRKTSDGLHRGL